MVTSRLVWNDTLKQWMRKKIQVQLQQVLEGEVTTFLGGVRREHRCEGAPADLPPGNQPGCGHPGQFSGTGGTVTVLRPRIQDLAERFERKVLPLLTWQTREVGSMLPDLYVQRLSREDFDGALQNLLGEGAPLPASSIQRLKMFFQLEYDAWRTRDLSHLAVAYWWADGLYVKAGLEDHKSALLTIVGTLITGERMVLACDSGKRESKESWLTLLRDLKHRGLTFPRLTVADGRLGLWAALEEIHPSGEQQGCWNHKIVSVLKTFPKDTRPKASTLLKAMAYAETQTECERRRDQFAQKYRKTEGKAVETLLRDWARMVTFYGFPQEHWRHLRTTKIVVSPIDSVQLRTNASRHYQRVEGAKVVMWKMLRVAEKSWRKLHAPELLPLVSSNVTFKDGVMTQSETFANAANHQSEKTAA
jgi:transposase-like protein